MAPTSCPSAKESVLYSVSKSAHRGQPPSWGTDGKDQAWCAEQVVGATLRWREGFSLDGVEGAGKSPEEGNPAMVLPP